MLLRFVANLGGQVLFLNFSCIRRLIRCGDKSLGIADLCKLRSENRMLINYARMLSCIGFQFLVRNSG
jgi:hypothetical protein